MFTKGAGGETIERQISGTNYSKFTREILIASLFWALPMEEVGFTSLFTKVEI